MKTKIQKTTARNTSFKTIVLLFTTALLITSCKPNGNEAGVVDDSKEAAIDSMKIVMEKQKVELAKQKSIDSMKVIMDQHNSKQVTSTHTTTTVTEKRKGWSRAAKGAVIGAGVGAVTGALVDKKHHGEGAIIGGLAGAGLGAGTGAIIDTEKNKK